ncbi:MAG: glycosyltransferase family 1 protein [Acidobacteriota bacterium]
MKIGINGWRLQGRRTGVARYLFNVVRYWDRALTGDRVSEINFYAPRPIDRRELDLPENIRERVLRPAAPMLVWENLRLGPASGDDVLFCPSYSRPLTARRRTVVTLFEATLKLHPEQFPREHWHTLPAAYLALYQWSGRHATLVLTTTEAARRDLTEAYGIDPEKIRVVPLAPPEDFQPLPGDPRLPGIRAGNVGADVPFFLFVGKMTPRRNVPLLMRAFADFKRENPSLPHRLLVVGLNTVHLDLAALSRGLSLGETFAHREYVSDEDLHLLYNAAEAFVLPYSYEALSLTTMEAQANGLPVITVDAPGLREVTGGKALLLPSPLTAAAVCGAMTRIATDPALRRRLSEDGLEFVRQFSWRRTSRETLAVLEEAAQAAGA